MTVFMPPDMVIRRSGIWNSRAPFHNFLLSNRNRIREYNVLTLAVYRLTYDVETGKVTTTSGRAFMKAGDAGVLAGKAWNSYRRSYPKDATGRAPNLTPKDVADDLKAAQYALREQTIVGYASMFETYVQCWALNYLLAKLESGVEWNVPERTLACRFSPIHSRETPSGPHRSRTPPSIVDIIKALPVIGQELAQLPHVNIDKTSGNELNTPVTPQLNALRTIDFWRSYRNLVVHAGGTVSQAFLERHSPFFEDFRKPYPEMRPLRVGAPLQFFDDTVRAMMTTLYKAANHLNQYLEDFSTCSRGHLFAPGPKPTSFHFPGDPPPAPKLLCTGDHELSWRFVSDIEFKANLLAHA